MARRETENNAYAKFWGDKQKTLWYVMVFSGVVNWYPLRLLGALGLHPIGTDDKGPPWDCALDVFDKSGIAC